MPEKSLATAQAVRSYFLDPKNGSKRVAALPEGTPTGFLNPKARGRIPAAATELYNSRVRKAEYVDGATRATAQAERKAAAKVRKAAARKGARKGIVVGARGPLPKALVSTPKG